MIKKIISFLLNFVMSILVLALICINIFSNTICSSEYIKQKLEENNFYERSYFDIKSEFENYTLQSGLELTILDDLITKEQVKNDINIKIDSIYSGNNVEIDSKSVRNELDSRINKVLAENKRKINDDEKESIKKYEDAIEKCYKDGILYGKYYEINFDILSKANKVIIIFIIIISILLIIINKSLLKYFAFLGINLLFSGVLCTSVKFLLEKRIQHILIFDVKFSNCLVSVLNSIIDTFFKYGIILGIVGIILIIIGSFEKLKKGIVNKKD